MQRNCYCSRIRELCVRFGLPNVVGSPNRLCHKTLNVKIDGEQCEEGVKQFSSDTSEKPLRDLNNQQYRHYWLEVKAHLKVFSDCFKTQRDDSSRELHDNLDALAGYGRAHRSASTIECN